MSQTNRYRADIDGLRALAILPVVAYHVGVPGLSGGFVGVDVFFVISGYLITQLLLAEQDQGGRIDIWAFYARRVRRLLPALTVVMIATLALGWVLLTPAGEQQDLGASAASASGFASNVFFWQARKSYFAVTADVMPLLHSWSLAVEEQFYIVWPPALILAGVVQRALGWPVRRVLQVLIVALGAASLIGAEVVQGFAQAAAFMLTPFRAWELGVGALVALPTAWRAAPRLGGWITLAGLAAIAAAVALYDSTTPFPSLHALAPTLGAAAVIAGGLLAPRALASRLLGSAPFTAIGKISYGWYLWHWPLLALVRANALGERSLPRDLGLAALALVLAILSRRFLEEPIRQRRWQPFASTRGSLVAGAAMLIICAGLGGGLWLAAEHSAGPRLDAAALREAARIRYILPQACVDADGLGNLPPPFARCLAGDLSVRPTVIVWGDSHAGHLISPLAEAAEAAGARLLARSDGGCRPYGLPPTLHGVTPARVARCTAFNQAVEAGLPDLIASQGATGLVIAAKWESDAAWAGKLEALVRRAHGLGLKVLLVADAPNFPFAAPQCLARRSVSACSLPRATVVARRVLVVGALRRIAVSIPDVRVFDPLETLCPGERCDPAMNGVILYRDQDHISTAGQALLAGPLEPDTRWLAGLAP